MCVQTPRNNTRVLCSVTECLAASVQRSQKQFSYPRGKGSRIGAERETGACEVTR